MDQSDTINELANFNIYLDILHKAVVASPPPLFKITSAPVSPYFRETNYASDS